MMTLGRIHDLCLMSASACVILRGKPTVRTTAAHPRAFVMSDFSEPSCCGWLTGWLAWLAASGASIQYGCGRSPTGANDAVHTPGALISCGQMQFNVYCMSISSRRKRMAGWLAGRLLPPAATGGWPWLACPLAAVSPAAFLPSGAP